MKSATAITMHNAPMQNISEIFASGDQWILPPIPLLDEEFDGEEDLGDDCEMPLMFSTGRSVAHN